MDPRPPLLLIHGASCDARVWHCGFIQSLEQQGWVCQAIDLPGHGRRRAEPGAEALGLDAYGQAIAEAVAACAQPPVLIGHSMGGFLAQQHVLSGGAASAVVLLASAPPHGMARELMAFALRHPLLALRLDLAGGHGDRAARLARVRAMLMTQATPEVTVAAVADQLQPESPRAMRELAMRQLAARPLSIPLLALAGAQDQVISLGAQRALAQRYGVPLEIFPEMAHMLPVEPGWPRLIDLISAFLAARLRQPPSGPSQEEIGGAGIAGQS